MSAKPFLTEVEEARRDERARLAQLLDEHADAIGKFAANSVAAVRLCALLVGLDAGPAQ
jgi:hypothetical protein